MAEAASDEELCRVLEMVSRNSEMGDGRGIQQLVERGWVQAMGTDLEPEPTNPGSFSLTPAGEEALSVCLESARRRGR